MASGTASGSKTKALESSVGGMDGLFFWLQGMNNTPQMMARDTVRTQNLVVLLMNFGLWTQIYPNF